MLESDAWLIAERTLREPDPVGRLRDLTGVRRNAAVLACGLREARHQQSWGHTGDGRQDVWLLSFRRGEELLALAAIDAGTGIVLALTYGAWEEPARIQSVSQHRRRSGGGVLDAAGH